MSIDKKEQILQAATQAFTLYGYEKASMSDIGKLVGMNKASLYYHYKDKLSLFAAMVEKKRNKHVFQMKKKLENLNPGSDKIIAFIIGEIYFVEELAINFLAPKPGESHQKGETSEYFGMMIEDDIHKVLELLQEAVDSNTLIIQSIEETANQILLITQGLLLVDCPLDYASEKRAEKYEFVRKNLKTVLTIFFRGLS